MQVTDETREVLLFPGQGSQRPRMGEGLFERFPDLVREADRCLGYSIEALCLRDPEGVLNRTEYTQPALYVVSVLQYLASRATRKAAPVFVAGHSLGEYCALFAAGAFDFVTGLMIVKKRGELMSRAPKGAMAAVINLDHDRVRQIVSDLPFRNIDIANINSRRQCVLSGLYDELTAPAVQGAFVKEGAAFIPLNVSAAFHSRLMLGVQEEFGTFLAGITFGKLEIPVVANYTARPYPTTDYAQYLKLQIANPVKWYESISWLAGQGFLNFTAVGPGNVLTKLNEKILSDPLTIHERAAPEPARPPGAASQQLRRPRLIFMYAGQGSQYYQMGRELYDHNPTFRRSMDRCSEAYQAACGQSLVKAIYDQAARANEFDDIVYSHAALYSVGVSLTEILREEGFEPDGVLGHSAGEYVALTAAGAMSWEDGLRLVIGQARLLNTIGGGGLLSVLTVHGLINERPEIFSGTELAGINFAGNFLLSGANESLARTQAKLTELGVVAVRLPVRQAFHSSVIDAIRRPCLMLSSQVALKRTRVTVCSSAHAGPLADDAFRTGSPYLWDVIRGQIRFQELMTSAFLSPEECFYVDLSATGSFATFLKHGYGGQYRCAPMINRFGNNASSLSQLRATLTSPLASAALSGSPPTASSVRSAHDLGQHVSG
jgi:trans-AT polyketide synthase/acyltransferase/oxidoreductase domain-containing protein